MLLLKSFHLIVYYSLLASMLGVRSMIHMTRLNLCSILSCAWLQKTTTKLTSIDRKIDHHCWFPIRLQSLTHVINISIKSRVYRKELGLRPRGTETRSQKPETRNQNPGSRNQKPETRNQEPETRNQDPRPSFVSWFVNIYFFPLIKVFVF